MLENVTETTMNATVAVVTNMTEAVDNVTMASLTEIIPNITNKTTSNSSKLFGGTGTEDLLISYLDDVFIIDFDRAG